MGDIELACIINVYQRHNRGCFTAINKWKSVSTTDETTIIVTELEHSV